jgi:hypothetical protein
VTGMVRLDIDDDRAPILIGSPAAETVYCTWTLECQVAADQHT